MNSISLNHDVKLEVSVNEAFNTLRTNILFTSPDTKVITVTSCEGGDGKSTVSFQLALGLAQINKKVLYIDADMRNSHFVQRHIGTADVKGLSHFLSAQASVNDVVYASDVEGLFIVFSGAFPPNPAELLLGNAFKTFISEARESFDYVIIDAPPMGLVSDAAICAVASDGAVLVVSSEKTRLGDAKAIKKSLEDAGVKMLGCVLNGIKNTKPSYYGKYSYSYYRRK